MSRRRVRLAQNAASLKDQAAFRALVFCEEKVNGLQCGKYAKMCYDQQGEKTVALCEEHRKANGYCSKCGNELTKVEKKDPHKDPGGLCGACVYHREAQYEDYDRYID